MWFVFAMIVAPVPVLLILQGAAVIHVDHRSNHIRPRTENSNRAQWIASAGMAFFLCLRAQAVHIRWTNSNAVNRPLEYCGIDCSIEPMKPWCSMRISLRNHAQCFRCQMCLVCRVGWLQLYHHFCSPMWRYRTTSEFRLYHAPSHRAKRIRATVHLPFQSSRWRLFSRTISINSTKIK